MPSTPPTPTAAALQKAAEGLTYPSETDSPWKAFAWADATGAPTVAEVRKRGKHKADSPAEEGTVEDLFRPLVTEQNWYGDDEKAEMAENRALFDAVGQNLAGATVIRLGERKIAVYVIGAAKEGGWAGLKTVAVET